MHYQASVLALAALFTTAHSHAALVAAVADQGESRGFLVDPELARNCTTINPCQQDATIIRDNEITANIVNACGRTEIAGNIDIGEQTETELAAGRMTQVKAGSMIEVTIHQVNADGAGPFECDMDETSNAVTTFTPLKVTNNVPGTFGLSAAKEQEFKINVQMPEKFNCIGASTGNICTVRCRNNAVAGPFGGCFAVQQTDGQGRKANEGAASVKTTQTLEGIEAQILQNKKDFAVAVQANQNAGAANLDEGAAAISALITATVNPNAGATQAPAAGNGNGNNNGNANQGKGNGNGRGQGNRGNAGNQQQAGNGNGAQAGAGAGNRGQQQQQGQQQQGNSRNNQANQKMRRVVRRSNFIRGGPF